MPTPAPGAAPRPSTPRIAWFILAVLGLVFALFAADRAVLGILKTTLGKEIGLTNQGYSVLVTSFMISYTGTYLFAGAWIHRWGTRVMLSLAVAGMSAATVIAGTAHGMAQLAFARFFLGIAEACVVPAITVAIFTWFASERRATAYSIATAVQFLAYIVAPPLVAWITLRAGWRWAFLVPGLSGFLVVGAWWWVNAVAGPPPPPDPETAPKTTRSPMREVLASPGVRMLILARIISDPFWFFFQYWQTAFLQEKIGLSLARVGQLTWIPPLVYVVTALALSAFSDRLVKKGTPAVRARLVIVLGVTALAPAAFLLPVVTTEGMAILLVTLTSVLCTTWLNMSSVFMGALTSRAHLASAIGLMSALGGVTSILFNLVVGSIVDRFGYTAPFWFGACLHPLAACLLAWHFLRAKSPPSPAATPAVAAA